MRSLHKEWKNIDECKKLRIRGFNGAFIRWNRRVRWYECNGTDIRLNFEDEEGSCNRYYNTKEEANVDWKAFKEGKTVAQLRHLA